MNLMDWENGRFRIGRKSTENQEHETETRYLFSYGLKQILEENIVTKAKYKMNFTSPIFFFFLVCSFYYCFPIILHFFNDLLDILSVNVAKI